LTTDPKLTDDSKAQDLLGKAAIITGAARNLGRGFAVALARRGADIVVHYNSDRSRVDAEETARLVREQGSRTTLVAGDLTNPATPAMLFDQAIGAFGGVDILINNAGVILKKPIGDITERDFDRSYALNAKAPFLCMQQAAARLRDGGRIINIGTSVLGMSIPFYGVYAGSKAAMEHLSRDLAHQLRGRGITVNTIAPGALDTPFFYAAESPESVPFVKQMTGGLGGVQDVVPLVEFLVSPGSQWLTGQILFINGGLLTR
jgi:NAD(P)-dependent dehydrogenase (short-subunit alcohol dehydrogenase family)